MKGEMLFTRPVANRIEFWDSLGCAYIISNDNIKEWVRSYKVGDDIIEGRLEEHRFWLFRQNCGGYYQKARSKIDEPFDITNFI